MSAAELARKTGKTQWHSACPSYSHEPRLYQAARFQLADELVIDVYSVTRLLPDVERYGLQSQIRRAAVSVPTNIVEGSVRRTEKAYLKYLETSLGSACEVRYLLRLCVRLRLLEDSICSALEARYTIVIKQMESLMARVAATARTRRRVRRPLADDPPKPAKTV